MKYTAIDRVTGEQKIYEVTLVEKDSFNSYREITVRVADRVIYSDTLYCQYIVSSGRQYFFDKLAEIAKSGTVISRKHGAWHAEGRLLHGLQKWERTTYKNTFVSTLNFQEFLSGIPRSTRQVSGYYLEAAKLLS